ncbi:hypothetical protein A4X13_0g5657 [Tilletia indica]|uniref:Uncharacterized protein n=1 Tax=Tilletia indica TaxID=43049 RepID=A0A8T8SRW7_9BASI|nr:hypothetical protein A4X13_0g5657 [Tilletia indica]
MLLVCTIYSCQSSRTDLGTFLRVHLNTLRILLSVGRHTLRSTGNRMTGEIQNQLNAKTRAKNATARGGRGGEVGRTVELPPVKSGSSRSGWQTSYVQTWRQPPYADLESPMRNRSVKQ